MPFISPVTQVRALTFIRRQRLLTIPGETVAIAGQDVSPIQVVARAGMPAGVFVLHASKVLGVAPEELEQHLLVSIGANVQQGTPLMRRPSRFGRTKLFRSPAGGVLREVRHGYLVLQQGGTLKEVRAMMEGRVAAVIPSRGVILETNGTLVQALWDSGKEGFGTLKMAANAPDYVLEADRIGAGASNAIVVTGVVEQPEVLLRLEEVGARGLIAGGLSAGLCKRSREVSFPVAVTDGVGGSSMAGPIFELLEQSEGRQASILAGSQRAGGQRSEIIIPLQVSDTAGREWSKGDSPEVGSLVRILRIGGPVSLGHVASLHDESSAVSGNKLAPGATVRLEDGKEIYVPYTNLDLIVQ
ncbi:MAG: hypothetical protein R3245_12650 [Kiloniellales bacterium]|nr:hypothetical protein [Kiloniellales bacterium]